jgi:hypothetical protein
VAQEHRKNENKMGNGVYLLVAETITIFAVDLNIKSLKKKFMMNEHS